MKKLLFSLLVLGLVAIAPKVSPQVGAAPEVKLPAASGRASWQAFASQHLFRHIHPHRQPWGVQRSLVKGGSVQTLTIHSVKVRSASSGDNAEPAPIPGGDFIPPDFAPPDGLLIRQFVPGPPELGPLFEGVDVEPNGIHDFRGFIAMAVLAGTATDGAGQVFDMFSDIRVDQGEYIGLDGRHHHGTFVEI